MPQCRYCAAPLPANSAVCEYCGAVNDVDLAEIHPYTVQQPETERVCPECETPMRTIDLRLGGTFLIEQCAACHGLFLDPNELETLLERAVPHAHEIDRHRLQELSEETWKPDPVRYRRCPVCRQFMQRKAFSLHSGVVVDSCMGHGIWLDAGELRRLLLWTQAGGMVLARESRG